MAPTQRIKVANEKASKNITLRGNVPKSTVSWDKENWEVFIDAEKSAGSLAKSTGDVTGYRKQITSQSSNNVLRVQYSLDFVYFNFLKVIESILQDFAWVHLTELHIKFSNQKSPKPTKCNPW